MNIIKKQRKIIYLIALLLALTSFSVIAFGSCQEVQASTIAKPSVSLSNASPTSIKVSWGKVSGAKKYVVYSSTSKSSGYKAIKTTTSTSFTNSSLTCGKTYYYKVKAVNGSKSATSAVASKKAVPAVVSSVKGSATCSSVKVSWAKASGVTGYEIYYKTSDTASYKKLATVTKNSYTHKNLKLGAKRYYKVRAYKTVNGKKIYGAFSTEISKKTAHTASSSWIITKKATCSSAGVKKNTCKHCNKEYTASIPKDSSAHSFVTVETPATCTTDGVSEYKCQYCGKVYSSTVITATGHAYPEEYTIDENGYRTYICGNCQKVKKEATCVIDLTNRTVSTSQANPDLAYFTVSASENDKLDIYPDGVFDFEIIGDAENLVIDINATDDCSIKLKGVNITNNSLDCINIKDKSEDESLASTDENPVSDVVPTVSISAIDGTVNTLTVTGSGNAIDDKCDMELKGHGKLVLNTVSTSISCEGKLEIKNISLDITSKNNRGIDTKKENLNSAGLIISTDYSNITIKPNATININAGDDGIRCKNMTIEALDEGDEPTVINIVSGGDGIQLEGKKGFTAKSGIITIEGAKSAFNNKSGISNVDDSVVLTIVQ
jgi:fibronectin type 3 domain-containing protein